VKKKEKRAVEGTWVRPQIHKAPSPYSWLPSTSQAYKLGEFKQPVLWHLQRLPKLQPA
jgi:hypothetical protein